MGRSPLSDRAADRLAALAAQAATAPTVLVQLIDGTGLRLAGGVGLPSAWQVMPDVPLTSTLAGLVLSSGFPVVVADVQRDARVPLDAPLRAVGGRAYLGFPIRDPGENAVGICSAIDYRPRVWTADEMRALDHAAQACAALVAKQLALHEVTAQRRVERFRAAELAVTSALAEADTVQEAGPRVLAAVAASLSWPHAELWLVDEGADVLRPVARWTAPEVDADLPVPEQL